ncbi:hypothetical protein [Nocardia sp. NBC_01327]|uniref:hypothetical protein n=1 Tax=Nocardia sp. NBC_01327 TaxID=2903593 RepID=UPI002E10ABA0|nr:hypothetical protein OG326_42050 [Nocardia sp. NBC_01327]
MPSSGPNAGKACFGIGLMQVPLPDGTLVWGKTGQDMGYYSGVFATRDLRRILVFSVGVTDIRSEAALTVEQRLAAAITQP